MEFQKDIRLAHNDVSCDIYVGTGSGKMLGENIDQASETIKIVSPYITPSLLKMLEDKYNKKVNVQLLTSYDCFKEKNLLRNNPNIYSFFTEEILVNEHSRKRFNLLTYAKKIMYVLAVVLCGYIIYSGIPIFQWPLKKEIIGIVVLIISGKNFGIFALKAKKEIYSHSKYNYAFPIRFIQPDNTFVHSKIFINDNTVYLGSVNFTYAGLRSNFETRIKIKDEKVVERFKMLFDAMYHLSSETFPNDYGKFIQKKYKVIN